MLASLKSVTSSKLGHYYAKDNYYFNKHDSFEVKGENLERFTDNQMTKNELISLTKNREMIAKDMTFSASKSFSIEYALGSPEDKAKIEQAWNKAIDNSIKFMQDSGVLTYKYKEDGQTRVGEAKGCVFIPVNHQVNRECEPQLHTHLLLVNSGFDKQGNNRSLDFAAICKHRKTIGRVVDYSFANELTKAGFKLRTRAIENTKGDKETYFEFAHIDDKTIDAFSTRRKQVLEAGKKIEQNLDNKISQAEINQLAAISSRKPKREYNQDEALENWRKIGEENGYTKHDANEESSHIEIDKYEKLEAVYNNAKAEIVEIQSGFTRMELIDTILREASELGQPINIDEANKLIDNDRDLIKAGTRKNEKFNHQIFVSDKFLQMEKYNMQAMADGKGQATPTLNNADEKLEAVKKKMLEEKGYKLDGEQQTAAKTILESKDFISGVQGYAGSGKTSLLKAVNDSSDIRQVIGITPSAKAAQVLEQETGIKSQTIDLFCKKNANNVNPKLRGALLIIDESSMVGTAKLNEIIKIAEKHKIQLVLVGDKNQLQPIAAGNDFSRMQEAGMTTSKLETIRRQFDPMRPENEQDLLKIGDTIAKDKNIVVAIKMINSLANQEKDLSASERRITVNQTALTRERTRAAAKEYCDDLKEGRKSIILTDTNARREQFSKEIRFYLKNQGRIDTKETTIKVLNFKNIEIEKGFSVNDRIIFGKNDYKNDLRNNETGTIKAMVTDDKTKQIILSIEKDNGKQITVNTNDYKHIDHGYALTVHKSQGITVDKAIVDISSKSHNTFNKEYVALSRHKKQLSIYSDDLTKIAKQGMTPARKLSAQEHLQIKEQKLALDAQQKGTKKQESSIKSNQSTQEQQKQISVSKHKQKKQDLDRAKKLNKRLATKPKKSENNTKELLKNMIKQEEVRHKSKVSSAKIDNEIKTRAALQERILQANLKLAQAEREMLLKSAQQKEIAQSKQAQTKILIR